MAFLTGRYPRSVGVTLSPTPLPETEVTIDRLLGVLAGHMMATSRDPVPISESSDVLAILAHSLPPSDACLWGRGQS
jgi:hypothetical protein